MNCLSQTAGTYCTMDKILEEKINQKIMDVLSNISEINTTAQKIYDNNVSIDFKYGIIVGRLYNSFFYQSKRILKRQPTSEEFSDFLEILSRRKNEIFEKL